MILMNYFATLNPVAFTNALPGNIAQGLIWGIMALIPVPSKTLLIDTRKEPKNAVSPMIFL